MYKPQPPTGATAWCRVTFGRERSRLTDADSRRIDKASGYLLSAQVAKTLTGPGQIALTLPLLDANGRAYLDVLKPNDRVTVQMRWGEHADTPMVGLVNSVRRSESVQENGSMVRTVQVQASDFTKLYQRFQIRQSYLLVGGAFVSRFREQLKALPVGQYRTNGQLMGGLLSFFRRVLSGFSELDFGAKDGQVVRRIDADQSITAMFNLVSFQGSLWAMMQEVASPPFNELYIDTLDGRPTLVFRTCPYDAMDALPSHAVPPSAWTERGLGYTDADVLNTFTVYNRVWSDYRCLRGPKIDTGSLRLYGLRPYDVGTNLDGGVLRAVDQGDAHPAKAHQQALRKSMTDYLWELQVTLHRWFGRNEQLKQGSVTLHGRPDIHVGQAVYAPDRGERYYCQGVSHDFAVKRHFRTTLDLVRGEAA